MTDQARPSFIERLPSILWGLVLFTLPVTTFRYLPSFYAGTTVKPLALYPLAVLFVLLVWRHLRSRKLPLPRAAVPLAAFFLVALAATLIGLLYDPLPMRGQTVSARAMRAWFSMGVGMVFFLSAYWMNRDLSDLRRSLKWLYAGLTAVIVWGALQALAFQTALLDENVLENIQLLFSTRGIPKNDRIVAFAFEPSWLADQIVIYYFPWLFAAILTGFRLTRYRWLEPALLVFSAGILVVTFSRSGILIAVAVTSLVLLITGRRWMARVAHWLRAPFSKTSAASLAARATRLLVVLAALTGVIASVYTLSQNRYFASFTKLGETADLYEYMLEISAGPRMAYAASGIAIYNDHPWTGVGLGASNLYIYDYLPDWALTNLPEINRRLSPDSDIVSNTKNLYVRLLAETGIFGFWLFSAFFLALLADIRRLFKSASPQARYIAVAGLFIWLAVALRNFTQDSFTFPIVWVGLGTVIGLASSRLQQS
ncbi:MAG: O-antigen ligase family protein [Anaerolineae bacterium]|nr:O-antigen ligase family protein [Anaerolineae bacterium]